MKNKIFTEINDSTDKRKYNKTSIKYKSLVKKKKALFVDTYY